MNLAPQPTIQISGLDFGFSPDSLVLKNLNLTVQQGERVAVMGESGSGKTTLLKIMTGLGGFKPISGVCRRSGQLVLTFQQPLLLDYMTVRKNISLPAVIQHVEQRVEDIVRILDLNNLLDRYPYQLSGGQQRRVALARALACPNIAGLAMDEPFSGLDEPLRERILIELETGLNTTQLTSVLATHSPFEAAFLADRIVFIGGTPATIVAEHTVQLPRGERYRLIDSPELFNEIATIRKYSHGHFNLATSGEACETYS